VDCTRWFLLCLVFLPIIDSSVNRQLLSIVHIGKAFQIDRMGLGAEVIDTGGNHIEVGIPDKRPDMGRFVVSDEDL
jgi:formate hydrogenlyase subunit 4